jgi:hypothetical protein
LDRRAAGFVQNALTLVHVLAFAALPTLYLYARNVDEVAVSSLTRPLLMQVAICIALLAIAQRRTHDFATSGANVSTLNLALFLLFPPMSAWIHQHWPTMSSAAATCADLTVFGFLAALAIVVVRTISRPALFLTITSLALVIATLPTAYLSAAVIADQGVALVMPPQATLVRESPQARDIYYIVLDGYGRDDVLSTIYGIDNSPFLGFLKSRGFVVARRASSNYGQTYLSLASSLNASYLNTAGAGLLGESNTAPLRAIIDRNAVAQSLRAAGYDFTFLSSDYSATISNSTADVCYCEQYGLSEFEHTILALSPFRVLISQSWLYSGHRRKVLETFDALTGAVERSRPRFVFAHIVAPHPPFVFDRHGNPILRKASFSFRDGSQYDGSRQEYLHGYREQVLFVNRLLQKAITTILERPGASPIMIVQGDHGPGSRLNQDDPALTDAHERLGILAAYRLPDRSSVRIPDTMSPVNNFRLVFNTYFATHLEMLPNDSYLSPWNRPYDVVRAFP